MLLPEAISWVAMLGIIAVFLAAYNIPVSFHTLMRVVGGNSIANMTSVTPGGAGVVQGFNVLSLKGITSSANATAYSVAQQLVTTIWSILFAIVLLVRAFGWSGGKTLVKQSYSEAKEKSSEQSAARKAKRQARRGRSTAADAEPELAEQPDEALTARYAPAPAEAGSPTMRPLRENHRLIRSSASDARSGTASSISIGSSIIHSITATVAASASSSPLVESFASAIALTAPM